MKRSKKTEKQAELARENDGAKPLIDPAVIERIMLGLPPRKLKWWQKILNPRK